MVKSIDTLASESSVGYVYKRWSLVFAIIGTHSGFETGFCRRD
jgi:hypothetical protein